MAKYLSLEQLQAGLSSIRQSPPESGTLEMIVARPAENERRVLETASFSEENGLEGDTWQQRGSRHTEDGSAHPGRQLTLMNARLAQLVAGERARWPLAGDQLYVDMDLSEANLPPGQRLQLGTAILEITGEAHTGCLKFAERYGHDALKFVNQPEGRELRLRGVYARVVQPGTATQGQPVRKLPG